MHLRSTVAFLVAVMLLLMMSDVPVARGQLVRVEVAPLPTASSSLTPFPTQASPPPTPQPTPDPTPSPLILVSSPLKPKEAFPNDRLLTFDDCERASLPGVVAQIVAALRSSGVTYAVFFLNGTCLVLVDYVRGQGYEVGNHGYSHDRYLSSYSDRDLDFQLRNGPPRATKFRPVFMQRYDSRIYPILADLGQTLVSVDINAQDSVETQTCAAILGNLRRSRPGQIIGMHNTNANTPKALEAYFSGKGC